MSQRIAAIVLGVALVAAGCSSGDVDRLATDVCDALFAHQAGDATIAQVEAEFERVVERADRLGASVDLIEAQVQVQCFGALQDYLDAASAGG